MEIKKIKIIYTRKEKTNVVEFKLSNKLIKHLRSEGNITTTIDGTELTITLDEDIVIKNKENNENKK